MSKEIKHSAKFVVKNTKGLHTRPATEIVRCASNFQSKIFLRYRRFTVNAKSLLGILVMAASKGSLIEVEAHGMDAKEAIEALIKLADNKFNMNY